MRLEHHLVGGYVRYISPYIIIIIINNPEIQQSINLMWPQIRGAMAERFSASVLCSDG